MREQFLIGCPVADRNWILPRWEQHVRKAAQVAGVDFKFLFLASDDDQETIDYVKTIRDAYIYTTDETSYPGNHRWNQTRYHVMVNLRNELLECVRELQPEYFFSLDSDILLHPSAIESALSAFVEFPELWAVGTKCYLSQTGPKFPNMGLWNSAHFNKFYRRNSNNLCKADVLMAAKFMTPPAYGQNYEFNMVGEDVGWSANIARSKGKMMWDGRVTNKHVMHPDLLDVVDVRVGW